MAVATKSIRAKGGTNLLTRSSNADKAILAIVQSTSNLVTELSSSINNRFIDLKADLDAKHLQNRTDAHTANEQLAENTESLSNLEARVKVTEEKVHSIIGTGDGGTGTLNEVRRGQLELNATVGEMKSTLTLIEERTRGTAASDAANNQFRWGWKGVLIAVGVIGTLATIGSFSLAILVFLIHEVLKTSPLH